VTAQTRIALTRRRFAAKDRQDYPALLFRGPSHLAAVIVFENLETGWRR